MKRIAFVMLSSVAVLVGGAQSVADGLKAIYYEKYKTAKSILEKLVAANPADVDANYWLGQASLNDGDVQAARAEYAKAMATTNQNPLIIVGMGQVELLEGKGADAKAHFEAALAATNNKKGGDPKILTAVGRANADGDSKTGDPVYGIDKLNTAAKLDLKDPEIYVQMGINQLKRGGEFGGESKKAYEEALTRDPKYAKAKLRIAKIFLSQNNKELFLPLMEEATQLDPNYGPAWLALYTYYAERDVNKAKEYLDKYIALADKDCETDFFYADYLLRAGNKEQALTKAKEMEGSCGGQNFPKLDKLYAIIYDRMGDSLNAKASMAKYISKEKPEKIGALDYANYAAILAKFPGNEAEVETNMSKAIEKDTTTAQRVEYATMLASTYGKASNFCGQAKWLKMVAQWKPSLTATDYYFWGDAVTKCAKTYPTTDSIPRSAAFLNADSIYGAYIIKYGDQPQGYAFRAIAAKLADYDTTKGTAIIPIDAYTTFLRQDTLKNKRTIINNYYYEIPYFAQIKDFQRVLDAVNAILVLDPTNAYATSVKKIAEDQLKARGIKPAGNSPSPAPIKPGGAPAATLKQGNKPI
ncbi:MAG: tetratricopeptide repeat protein [Chitinophagaceae bacterium]